MKKTKKILALASSAVLLVTASVMGTMAYLTSTTNAVNNTFTVGNVGFDQDAALDEAKVNMYGEKLNQGGDVWEDGDTLAERVQANQYKLIPGHEYVKDPTVHIAADSEDCWLFVKVDNGISAIEAAGDTTIAKQMETLGWTAVTTEGFANVYYYNNKVSADDGDVTVFETFTLANDANVADYASASIKIQAYAVQADGFDSATEAWSAAPLNEWKTPAAE